MSYGYGNRGGGGYQRGGPQGRQGGGYQNRGGGYGRGGGGGGRGGNEPPAQEPRWITDARSEIEQGTYSYRNRLALVGQVAPTQSLPDGYKWVPGQRGGVLQVNLKVRKETWPQGAQEPNVKKFMIRVVIFGQKGQWLMQQIGVGTMLAVEGEYRPYVFLTDDGTWVTIPQVLPNDRNPNSVVVLGDLEYIDENGEGDNSEAIDHAYHADDNHQQAGPPAGQRGGPPARQPAGRQGPPQRQQQQPPQQRQDYSRGPTRQDQQQAPPPDQQDNGGGGDQQFHEDDIPF